MMPAIVRSVRTKVAGLCCDIAVKLYTFLFNAQITDMKGGPHEYHCRSEMRSVSYESEEKARNLWEMVFEVGRNPPVMALGRGRKKER